MKVNKTLLFFFILIKAGVVIGQEQRNFQSWYAIELEYEPNKRWDFEWKTQLRMDHDPTEINQYLTELSMYGRIVKGFKVGGGLRYTRENDTRGNVQGYRNQFRYHADALFSKRLDDFRIQWRLRYQNRDELGFSRADGDISLKRIRLKTSVDYNIRNWKLDPDLSGELFSRFEPGEQVRIDRYRVTLGTSYKIKKAGRIGLFYRYESSINRTPKRTFDILGLNYKYTFK